MDERYDFYRQEVPQENYVLPPGMSETPGGLALRGGYFKNLVRQYPSDTFEIVELINVSATVAEWWYDAGDHTQIWPWSGSYLWFSNLIPLLACANGLGNAGTMALSELKMTFALLDAAGAVLNDGYVKMRFSNVAGGAPYSFVRTPPVDGIKTRAYDTATSSPLPINSFNGIRLTCSTSTNLISSPGGSVGILKPGRFLSEIAGAP